MADEEPTPDPTPPGPEPKKLYNDYNQQRAAEYQQQALTDAQVADDVLHNPRYDAFFALYQPQARQEFVRGYVHQRHMWTQHGDFAARQLTQQLTQFEAEAYRRLWDIQQKKLFDLQCEWRAELVEVPGVQSSADFGDLAQVIENCTVVPPISPAELDLYLAWVRQADCEADLQPLWDNSPTNWQDYEEVKSQLDDDEQGGSFWSEKIPEWYEFHNQHTGNGRLLRLPDRRGQKENYYRQAAIRHQRQEREIERQQQAPAPPPDPRPAYRYGEVAQAMQTAFAQEFEPAAVNRQREAYLAANRTETWEDEELREALDFLGDIEEEVPIEAGPDWRLAVRRTAASYKQQKLLASLPLAYEAYCQRQEWGIAQPLYDDLERYKQSEWYNKSVLDGRELLGEPRDFNF